MDIHDDRIYKYMFESEGKLVVKRCEIVEVVEGRILFFEERSGDVTKKKVMDVDDLETVSLGGKYKMVYLDHEDLRHAKDILIMYYRNRISNLKDQIADLEAAITKVEETTIVREETGNA